MTDTRAEWTVPRDAEELCGFFRRSSHYELLQAGSGVAGVWGAVWTFPARDRHAAEKAGWMMRRLVGSAATPVRHACRVRLRAPAIRTNEVVPRTAEVVVVTILPARAQFVLLLASGNRIAGLPFLRCGAAHGVAVALGLVPTNEESKD